MFKRPIVAPKAGFVSHIECDEIGVCALMLGGGRETKESIIDLSVGLVLQKKVGDYVEEGEALALMYGNDIAKMDAAESRFLNAYTFTDEKPAKLPLIKGIIS